MTCIKHQYTVYPYTLLDKKTGAAMKTFIAIKPNQPIQMCATSDNQAETVTKRFWQKVARIQENKRWLCVVAPQSMPSRQELEEMGVQLNKMLVIHQNKTKAIETIIKAVKAGKCSTVVGWVDECSSLQYQALTALGSQNNCNTLLVKADSQAKPNIAKQAA